jgi:hypothetical protein
MFFRQCIDGVEFGYKLAEAVRETVNRVDAVMEQRLGMKEAKHYGLEMDSESVRWLLERFGLCFPGEPS